jgi:hypothetical protein
MMHELGFIHCDINPEGFHRMEKKLDYMYFTVTVSLVYYSNELAVWIDDNKPMLFCGHVPHGIKTQTDLDEFVDELVLDAIKLD